MRYQIKYGFSDGDQRLFNIEAGNKLDAIRELDKHLTGLGKVTKEDYSRRSIDQITEVK